MPLWAGGSAAAGTPAADAAKTVSGDADAFATLASFLDTDAKAFLMHQR